MKLLKIAGIFMALGVSIVCSAQTTKTKDVKNVSRSYLLNMLSNNLPT